MHGVRTTTTGVVSSGRARCAAEDFTDHFGVCHRCGKCLHDQCAATVMRDAFCELLYTCFQDLEEARRSRPESASSR